MSWDAMVCRTPGVDRIEDLRDESFEHIDLDDAIEAAVQILGDFAPMVPAGRDVGFEPGSDPASAAFLRLEGPDLIGEMRLPDRDGADRVPVDAVRSVSFNMRWVSDDGRALLLDYADRLDARVLDLQTGDWLTRDGASFEQWDGYRDRVIAPQDADPIDENDDSSR